MDSQARTLTAEHGEIAAPGPGMRLAPLLTAAQEASP